MDKLAVDRNEAQASAKCMRSTMPLMRSPRRAKAVPAPKTDPKAQVQAIYLILTI